MFNYAIEQEFPEMNLDKDALIALVDDDPAVLQVLTQVLQEFGFNHLFPFPCANDALKSFESNKFDVVITDFKMPGIDGFELLQQLHKLDSSLPVIVLTGHADMTRAVESFKQGAFDFIVKPFQPFEVAKGLKKALAARRLSKLEQDYKEELEKRVWERTRDYRASLEKMTKMNREIIHRLGMAAEHRDDETGAHIARIAFYVYQMALILGQSDEQARQLALASTMHDIGKIGIPDSILFKTGKLSREEFDVIKTHTTIGEKILSGSSFEVLDLAASIAATHHEKWDGSGYPHGLRGEQIPLSGRITMIADHYDALRNRRPYKPEFSHEKAFDIITNGDGRTAPEHFAPEELDIFTTHADEFDRIFTENKSMNHQTFQQTFLCSSENVEYLFSS